MPGSSAASSHERFMRLALQEARQARHIGEVPVGAVLVFEQDVVATGFNQPIHAQDPTAHAEAVAIRRAARALGNYRLPGTTLYVTLEPCLMCVGAIINARIATVVYGADEPRSGAVSSLLKAEELRTNHHFQAVGGVLEAECRGLITDFFKFRREQA